ncbi:MAG: hypothetical protein WD077_16195 [Bacteroidia bacterium]
MRFPILWISLLLVFSASCSHKVNLSGVKAAMITPEKVHRQGRMPNYLHITPGPELVEHYGMQYEEKLREWGAQILRFPEPNAAPPTFDSGTVIISVRNLIIREAVEVDTPNANMDDIADGSMAAIVDYRYSATTHIIISKAGSDAEPQQISVTSEADPEAQKRPFLKRIFGPKEPEPEKVEIINEQVFLNLVEINGRLAGRKTAKAIKKMYKKK